MVALSTTARRTAAISVVALLVLALAPGIALAAPVQGAGGTIVIDDGETVDGVQVAAGTVVIRGTVTNDVEVAAGTLVITGEVHGDVSAGAGAVDIQGRVDGDITVGTGSLTVGEDAVIGGALNAGAGSATVAGTVVGDAAIGAGSLVLAPTATFQSDLRYDADLDDQGATVEGQFDRDRSLSGVTFAPRQAVGEALFDLWGFVVTLIVGAVLLLAFPEGSRRLAAQVEAAPLVTGVYGFAALVGVPVLLLLVALTILGLPLAVLGGLLFAFIAWIGSIYGRYAVGEWLLGYTATENRWVALLVGMVAVGLVGLVPILGGLVQFLVFLLGLGGLAFAGRQRYRQRRSGPASGGAAS